MHREGGYMMSFLHEINSLVFKITISYFLYLWFFRKKKDLKTVLTAIAFFIINVVTYKFFDDLFHSYNKDFLVGFIANSLTYIGFGVIFFALHQVKKSYEKQLEIEQLLKEKQLAEIKSLKARVNPHFLFNTLNTIYVNALKKDEKTPDLILKLSDGFRYLLHEGQQEFVTLDKELQHLKDYIDLQKERLADKLIINYLENIDDFSQQIPPLLFIGFIENAFKYTSILKGKNHLIDVKIELIDKKLTFYCSNPYQKNQEIELEWKESGLGIKNIKQRLQLLYPEKHQLKIEDENGLFIVKLNITL